MSGAGGADFQGYRDKYRNEQSIGDQFTRFDCSSSPNWPADLQPSTASVASTAIPTKTGTRNDLSSCDKARPPMTPQPMQARDA